MPNIKSAKKRVKVNAVKAARNKAARSALRTEIKNANAAIVAGENKEEALKAADKNTAARKKSALAKKANA